MNINITTISDGIGFQIFDAWYAYKQSLSHYDPKLNISYSSVYKKNYLNILLECMPTGGNYKIYKDYDRIFFCNRGESLLSVCSDFMHSLQDKDNVFYISNSFLDDKVPIKNKNICWPHLLMLTRDYWLRQFYPQHYENRINHKLRKLDIIAINGKNRANRNLFFEKLLLKNKNIKILNNFGNEIWKLDDSAFEHQQDTIFRKFVNRKYSTNENLFDIYNSQRIEIGINFKFGSIPPGFFVLSEYFDNSCVIFPESSWQNNELTLTEKALKCFYSGSLPFPIAGARTNLLYNQCGFYTSYNLLPEHLQTFDVIENHYERYKLMTVAVDWLYNNRDVFLSKEFFDYTHHNRMLFLDSSSCYIDSLKKLDSILTNEI